MQNKNTSNSKFLPLNSSEYKSNCAYSTPNVFNKYAHHYPHVYPEDVNADISRHPYNYYHQPTKGLIVKHTHKNNDHHSIKNNEYDRDYRHITNHNNHSTSEPVLNKNTGGMCNLKGGTCGENPHLDDVLNPKYNLREVVKQIILLEDHLNSVKKRCADCITKHMLFIEGLLEEAIGLDKENTCRDMTNDALKKFNIIRKKYFREYKNKKVEDDNFYCSIAQELRKIRKPIMNNEDICRFGCK
jgi:hypothetical protein